MEDSHHTIKVTLALALVLIFVLSGCAAPQGDEIHTFLLRTNRPDVVQLSEQLLEAVTSQLEASRSLGEGYPIISQIEFEPDPSSPGAQLINCAPTPSLASTTRDCILLNEYGDFVRTQPITWQSAAFFMYRVYVAREEGLVTVDPTKDFVALDVFLLEEENLWVVVDQAIRSAAAALGASPFRP
jgi:hypothetical protein